MTLFIAVVYLIHFNFNSLILCFTYIYYSRGISFQSKKNSQSRTWWSCYVLWRRNLIVHYWKAKPENEKKFDAVLEGIYYVSNNINVFSLEYNIIPCDISSDIRHNLKLGGDTSILMKLIQLICYGPCL